MVLASGAAIVFSEARCCVTVPVHKLATTLEVLVLVASKLDRSEVWDSLLYSSLAICDQAKFTQQETYG